MALGTQGLWDGIWGRQAVNTHEACSSLWVTMGPEQSRPPCWDSLPHQVRVTFSTPPKKKKKKRWSSSLSLGSSWMVGLTPSHHPQLPPPLKKYHTWYILVRGWRESIRFKVRRLTSWQFNRKQTFPGGRSRSLSNSALGHSGAGVVAGGLVCAL